MAKAKCADSRVHFKNVVEVVAAVRGMKLARAKAYLENVLEKKEVRPHTAAAAPAAAPPAPRR